VYHFEHSWMHSRAATKLLIGTIAISPLFYFLLRSFSNLLPFLSRKLFLLCSLWCSHV